MVVIGGDIYIWNQKGVITIKHGSTIAIFIGLFLVAPAVIGLVFFLKSIPIRIIMVVCYLGFAWLSFNFDKKITIDFTQETIKKEFFLGTRKIYERYLIRNLTNFVLRSVVRKGSGDDADSYFLVAFDPDLNFTKEIFRVVGHYNNLRDIESIIRKSYPKRFMEG